MRHRGFSSIEIIIAIVIAGALVGVAIPTWQAWQLRGQIEHGVDIAGENVDEIDGFYRTRGRLPRHSGEVGLPLSPAGEGVEYVSWRRSADEPEKVGYLDVQMNLRPLGSGVTPFVLEARVAGDVLQWRCVSARQLGVAEEITVADFYLPSRCRQGGQVSRE